MEENESRISESVSVSEKGESGKPKKKARGYCDPSESTSHTHFFKKFRHNLEYKRITRDEYLEISESISSSATFHCVHGSEGKQYTEKGLLKRNVLKELDPIPIAREWTEDCPPVCGWELAEKIKFLVTDSMGVLQLNRLEAYLRDFIEISSQGYNISILNSLCLIIDYIVETLHKQPTLIEYFVLLLKHMEKPILLNVASDVVTHFEVLRSYIGFLGYLLIRMQDDKHFDLVSKATIWHLSAPDALRGQNAVKLRHALAAAPPVLYQTTVRMIAVATSHRFPTFLEIALLLACDTVENCIDMMKENIIENIFYRFNPYFPERRLPMYDINPIDPQDCNIKLGDSSLNMSTTLSLLLVLVKTTKQYLEENPKYRVMLPCPDGYGLRCFVWAFRYECRARYHFHEKITLTVIAYGLLNCFGVRLTEFSSLLAPDVMTLSVLTEIPPRADWTGTVNFNKSQADVQFKKLLIYLSVDLLKVFPYNSFMVESRHWLLGLMYLLDPGLSRLRTKWSQSLFAELRKTALQALVCALPLSPPDLAKKYGLIRRIMWYIEWYSESPYELPILYWCVRLLQVATSVRGTSTRKDVIRDLFDTHGIIIIIHLCYTLLQKKKPLVEKTQAILAICLRLLTSSVESDTFVTCYVYPTIKWPISINLIAKKMLNIVLESLEKHYIVSERWLISLLNLIWEGIIWRKEYRKMFVADNGVYKLLDLITMTRAPVQCIALALLCDIARAGDAVGQLVTWRARLDASNANPIVVKRGCTIATLLTSIFRNDCETTGVCLSEAGVLEDLEFPLMSSEMRKELYNPDFREGKHDRTRVCLSAAELAGSRMSKTYALLYMLSEDLEYKVRYCDETYNLYKNIKLATEDEALLVLCSHYLSIKLNEAWSEIYIQNPGLLPEDEIILDEFIQIGKGWAKEIKLLQETVLENNTKKVEEYYEILSILFQNETGEENSLYAFLGRVRLNIALDALREVNCVARSADRERITHAMLFEAVRAHHRRSIMSRQLEAPILRTYEPSLDDQNITGQNVKVHSIEPKNKAKKRDIIKSTSPLSYR